MQQSIPNPMPHAVPQQLANGTAYFNGQLLCSVPVIGSQDPQTANFMPNANQYSGRPQRKQWGCTDPAAWNYNPTANVNLPGFCKYRSPTEGCTDPNALNYDPKAQQDNGRCVAKVPGCNNPFSPAFNPKANINDGSCTLPFIGCTDRKAKNYDPSAVINSFCWYGSYGCKDTNSPSYDHAALLSDPSKCCPASAPKPQSNCNCA